jgi:guanylate kinase
MEERPRSPLLLIVSSPSGAGKTTLTNALRARVGGVNFSVSHTTRKPRASEQHGREY